MNLREVIEALDFEVKAGQELLDREANGGYVSDLLSDVIANSRKGDLWLTLQTHQNIVAVAVLKELAGIVIIGAKEPAPDTLLKAQEEGVVLMTSTNPAFLVAGRLYQMGLGGSE
jgi:hypothetical protein